MPLEIKRFTTAPTQEECDQLSALEWKIHNDGPLNSSWELYKGPSIEEYCRNRRKSRTMSAGTNSLKLITNENAEIIGSANWTVYLENHNQFTDIISKLERYPHLWPTIKPNIKLASQWEEDTDIASMANQYYLREFLARLKHMNGPHLFNAGFAAKPPYKKEGEAMLLRWGVELADERDLECFSFEGDLDRPLLESFGFIAVEEFVTDPQTENPSEEWMKLKEKIFPKPWRTSVMWRPKKSAVEKGQIEYKVAAGSLDVEAEIEGREEVEEPVRVNCPAS